MDETFKSIDRNLDAMIASNDIGAEDRPVARLLLVARQRGCQNIDRLSKLTGLNRDTCVRPIGRRLRASGIWLPSGETSVEYLDGTPGEMMLEFVLHILCAQGKVVYRKDVVHADSQAEPLPEPGVV